MKRFKKRPSPAMIVAMTALFISLVGTAVAGPIAEISLNRGEKKQIRKISRNISGKVSNRRITKRAPGLNVATARNAVIANVANASVKATNAQNAENAENAENAQNAENAENAQNAENASNAAKLGGIDPSGFLGSGVVLVRQSVNVAAGARGFQNVPCPANHRVIGGGVRFDEFNNAHEVSYNGPAFAGNNTTLPAGGTTPTAWQASAVNGAASEETLFVWALCAPLN